MGRKRRSVRYIEGVLSYNLQQANILRVLFYLSDSVTMFIRVTWLVCFVVGAIVLYSAFRREEEAFSRLFAEQEKKFEFKAMHIPCSPKYLKDINNYPGIYNFTGTYTYKVLSSRKQILRMYEHSGCKPKKCGRYVMDNVVTTDEVDIMLNIVKRGLSYGGSSGGASVLDLHTGAMSKGVHFVNLYKMESPDKLFKSSELQIYKYVECIVKVQITHYTSTYFLIVH